MKALINQLSLIKLTQLVSIIEWLDFKFDFQLIDSMSYSKQNVFHWHLTDSQSFPLLMPSLPDFVRYGAYRPDQVYMPDQVHLAIWLLFWSINAISSMFCH